MLAIAIPTFNRADQLKMRLVELSSQLNEGVRIHVFDNGSDDHTKNIVKEFSGESVTYSSWAQNRGISRSIMRALEECEGDWTWLLSDDDPVRPDAVDSILKAIRDAKPGTLVFKAQGNGVKQDGEYLGLEPFLLANHLMDLSYISALVFHKDALAAGIRLLAPGAYTMIPHALLSIAALNHGYAIRTINLELTFPQKGEHRVSRREFLLGVAAIPGFFSSKRIRSIVALQMRASSRWMVFSALAQANSPDALDLWRTMVRLTNGSFSAYGAGFLAGGWFSRWHSLMDTKRECFITFARYLPDYALLAIARRISNKTKQKPISTHFDSLV